MVSDPGVQILMGFVMALVFAPFGVNLRQYVGFYILYEIFYYKISGGEYPYWSPRLRMLVFIVSVLGFLIGKQVVKTRMIEDLKTNL